MLEPMHAAETVCEAGGCVSWCQGRSWLLHGGLPRSCRRSWADQRRTRRQGPSHAAQPGTAGLTRSRCACSLLSSHLCNSSEVQLKGNLPSSGSLVRCLASLPALPVILT